MDTPGPPSLQARTQTTKICERARSLSHDNTVEQNNICKIQSKFKDIYGCRRRNKVNASDYLMQKLDLGQPNWANKFKYELGEGRWSYDKCRDQDSTQHVIEVRNCFKCSRFELKDECMQDHEIYYIS